ncbi:MAG: 1-deoxy-D-xylulose-5-phosphate reductoisomerase [Firmicutes bacterium]|nr:1-deoxy-D-xylulose-5-phosphate reductoisomerase [Bacillota bacterium]
MKNIYLLGATGSIGRQTLEIVDKYPSEFKVVTLSARTRMEDLIQLIEKYNPKFCSVQFKKDADHLTDRFPDIVFGYGKTSLIHAATFQPKDRDGVLINALVGIAGLQPTVEAIKIKRNVLLANKETLVVGGSLVMELAKENQVEIFPIDSEHSAIWQCMQNGKKEEVSKVIITASGGAFRNKSFEELKNVTKADALKHPNWTMGEKITIDSATMMNKGFEVMEAIHLFGLLPTQIETVIHPESIIHSMVEYIDHSIIAQISSHDMRLPIQYAMFYPNRKESIVESIDFAKLSSLHFETMKEEKYPCFRLAMEAIQSGHSMPCVLNAANEAAVDLFLKEKIEFLEISNIIETEMKKHQVISNPSLEDLLRIDLEVKENIYHNH